MTKEKLVKLLGLVAALAGAGVSAASGDYVNAAALAGAALSSAGVLTPTRR